MANFEFLVISSIIIAFKGLSSQSSSSEVSFLTADSTGIYRALLFEAGASAAADMRWSPVFTNGDVMGSASLLADFDFDPTRRRLVFANSDAMARTVSVSECYLLRPNEDRLSCSLTTALLYRQIVEKSIDKVFIAIDWLTGDVYITLPEMLVRCPMPQGVAQGDTPQCEERPVNREFHPSIVKIDPFSKSLIWNQIHKPPSSRFCPGINSVSLTNSSISSSTCLLRDKTVTSLMLNYTTASIAFTNKSREAIFSLNYQSSDFPVTVARHFVNEGHKSVVDCPAPVRSLTYLDDTDIFFWTAPDFRQRTGVVEFSQIAFEVDGFCSNHPTSKDLNRILILQRQPRLEDRFFRSTLTEQIRCSSTPGPDFSLNLACDWLYFPASAVSDERIREKVFFLIEIDRKIYYRTFETSFGITISQQQLVNLLHMSNSMTLNVGIRACTKWQCALPANSFVKQTPFVASGITAYRAFGNTLSSTSVAIRWRLPRLFQGATRVTVTPEHTLHTFYHQNSSNEEAVFEYLSTTTTYIAKIQTCNEWNCSEPTRTIFLPNDLDFEPIKVCWQSRPSRLELVTIATALSKEGLRKDLSSFVSPLGQVTSALYLMSPLGITNGSIVWTDQQWRIYLTQPTGDTSRLVEAPTGRFRRRSLAVDYLTSRVFWLEDNPNKQAAELHNIRLEGTNSIAHNVYNLPKDQVWNKLIVNSSLGAIFLVSGEEKYPTGALVFDLLTNKVMDDLDNPVTAAVDRLLVAERDESTENCRDIFDGNVLSLYENRVCFDIENVVLETKTASTPKSVSILLENAVNQICQAPSALKRLILQTSSVYLLNAGSNVDACLQRRGNGCVGGKFDVETSTANFNRLPPFSDFTILVTVKLPIFNQSRLWNVTRIRTQASIPSEPQNFRCNRTTPEEIVLKWDEPVAFNGPSERIEYILKWQEPSEKNSDKLVPQSMKVDGSMPLVVTHLQPGRQYEFRLVARSRLFPSTETSQPVFARCKTASIGNFTVLPVAHEHSKLAWRFSPSMFTSNPFKSVSSAAIIYGPEADLPHCPLPVTANTNVMSNKVRKIQICSGSNCTHSDDIVKAIDHLKPKASYSFCLLLNYYSMTSSKVENSVYVYPKYSKITIETGGFKVEPPRVWKSADGIEVLLPTVLGKMLLLKKGIAGFDKYQLLYSNNASFCEQHFLPNDAEPYYTAYNLSSHQRRIALKNGEFDINRQYWFRTKILYPGGDDLISDCSDSITVKLSTSKGLSSSGLVAASSLIALVSCASVVAFCLSLAAVIIIIRRAHLKLSAAKLLISRYFCRLLDYSGFSSRRFDATYNDRSRSMTTGLPYSGSTAAALMSTSSRAAGVGLWSLSTSGGYLSDSPRTATSSTGMPGASSVFSFDCDLTSNATGTVKAGLPMRFMTLTNQIYATPTGLSNWLLQLPASVLRLSRDQISISRFLGAGAFGEVYEGELTVSSDASAPSSEMLVTRVAVKTLKPNADSDRRASFCREAALMSHFHHPNIVRLIGMCVTPSPMSLSTNNPLSTWPLMVLELMNGGDLLGYLRRARSATERSMLKATLASSPVTSSSDGRDDSGSICLTMLDLFDICIDVAAGCRYLEKNRFCHRDIAARNCLVSCPVIGSEGESERRRVVKIGDFGLARSLDGSAECYRKVGEGLMPVRWMSPESLNDGLFTSQSDVWSFGVLMYEVFSLGRQPYAGKANHEVFEMVKTGSHPQCPRDCPTSVCRLMLSCFQENPDNRPSFHHLLRDLRTVKSNILANAQDFLKHQEDARSNNVKSALMNSRTMSLRRPTDNSHTASAYSTTTALKKAKHHASMRMVSSANNSDASALLMKRFSSSTAITVLSPIPDSSIVSTSVPGSDTLSRMPHQKVTSHRSKNYHRSSKQSVPSSAFSSSSSSSASTTATVSVRPNIAMAPLMTSDGHGEIGESIESVFI